MQVESASHALRRRLVFLVVLTIAVLAFAQAAHANGIDDHSGNRGSVKVDDDDIDNGPANHPHVICALRIVVEHGFGFPFDIDFLAQDPTTRPGPDQRLLIVHVPDGDNVSGIIDLRAFVAGIVPNPQQGFHVFITVHLPGGDKHKVVWVQLCPPGTTTTTAKATTTSTTVATTIGTAVISGGAQTTTTTGVPTQVLGENFVKPAANAEPTALANTGNPFSPAVAVGLVLTGVSVLGAARHVSGRRLESTMRRVVDKER